MACSSETRQAITPDVITENRSQEHYPAYNPDRPVLPYEFVAHAYSSLTFLAYVTQASFDVNAVIHLTASLREYSASLLGSAKVRAEVQRPDGATDLVTFEPASGDQFTATYNLLLPGVFNIHVRALGETMLGTPFERERTLTAVAIPGGDIWDPKDPETSSFCELFYCLLEKGTINKEFVKRLEELGIDLPKLLKCLGEQCRSTRDLPEACQPRNSENCSFTIWKDSIRTFN